MGRGIARSPILFLLLRQVMNQGGIPVGFQDPTASMTSPPGGNLGRGGGGKHVGVKWSLVLPLLQGNGPQQ